ncbi:NADH:flavin oxidoreductase [Amycolatopsis sp. GM8]|uniref:NADH:flavin oxidoreductase n=1 Tax=Amycolatopsis sp. GM8 TaxID=2896530 RepID=UPI001F463B36|nr:NADH:flavin oxidoreductase [Amycolatopsis sp. GM8]
MYEPLFAPLRLGSRTARNRIVHAPMSVCYGDTDGFVTRPQIEHYARRAQGGAGTIITENFAVNVAGRQMPRQTLVAGPEHLPGLTELAAEIKRHGALALVQLVHAGRYAGPWDVYEQARRLAPSPVSFELTPGRVVTPAEITTTEIEESIEAFGRAAELCQQAGFDGVDIHAAQGFLLSEFLSPAMNRRTDDWGGSFDGRVRLTLEVLREVRRRTGPEFVVGVHLMSDELTADGWTIKDGVRFVPSIAEEGADFVFPIPATFESLRLPPNVGLYGRPGYGLADVAAFRQATGMTIIANGGLGDPAAAAAVLERGDADAIGLARPLLTDPDWTAKAAAGTPEEIRTCPCDPPQCLRTQLTGAVCAHWPAEAVAQGYLGY